MKSSIDVSQLLRVALCAALVAMTGAVGVAQTNALKLSPQRTVVFVCEHGAAKSVIAAAYFNKLADERHLKFHAIARGIAPQSDLSEAVVAGLQKDGTAFSREKPRGLTNQDASNAVRIVAFCPIPGSFPRTVRIDSFGVPAPKDGYDRSRDAILAHVKKLIGELQTTAAHR